MKAELIDQMGTDLTVVNAARVSFDKESTWDSDEPDFDGYSGPILSEKDTKLISYLAKHNHFTPFTHCVITLRETVPIFVARQRFKHTVGFTYNEVSRRYVDDTPEFYEPNGWRGKPINSKQGSNGVVTDKWINLAYMNAMETCLSAYNTLLDAGVAPEQARMVLPQSMYTSYYTTGSLAAFARAYKLRSEETAQFEIRELAKQWNQIIRPLFPISWGALVD